MESKMYLVHIWAAGRFSHTTLHVFTTREAAQWWIDQAEKSPVLKYEIEWVDEIDLETAKKNWPGC
jgi:hypothetical protein